MFNKFYINLIIINLYGMICQLDVKLIVAISSVVHTRIILIRSWDYRATAKLR